MLAARGATRPRNRGMPQRPGGGMGYLGGMQGPQGSPQGPPRRAVSPGGGDFGMGRSPGVGGMQKPSHGVPGDLGQSVRRGGGMGGGASPASGFDFAAYNAWDDPNISGVEAPIQQGYGGFTGLDTMGQTKLNNFLNQYSTGGARENMMNQVGYFNEGNPYTPQVGRGVNRAYRAQANANQQTGDYSAPGTYQHMGQGQTDANGAPILNSYGGYTGITNVDPSGAAQYTPFDINRQGGGRTRRTRTFGQVMQ